MKRIKNFSQFLNEGFFDNPVFKTLSSILSPGSIEYNQPDEEIVTGGPDSPLVSSSLPGNDDFALYMQHQQGLAGATGIVKALNGTGGMHPETIKTKKKKRKD